MFGYKSKSPDLIASMLLLGNSLRAFISCQCDRQRLTMRTYTAVQSSPRSRMTSVTLTPVYRHCQGNQTGQGREWQGGAGNSRF
jgi:hypothetical protein